MRQEEGALRAFLKVLSIPAALTFDSPILGSLTSPQVQDLHFQCLTSDPLKQIQEGMNLTILHNLHFLPTLTQGSLPNHQYH